MSKKYTVELTALAQEQILQIGEYIRDELQVKEGIRRSNSSRWKCVSTNKTGSVPHRE